MATTTTSEGSTTLSDVGACKPQETGTAQKRVQTTRFTNAWIVLAGKLVQADLFVREGIILDAAKHFWQASCDKSNTQDVVIDCEDHILAPGFIDIQLNGAYGVDFSDPQHLRDAAKVEETCRSIALHGVTSFYPTVVTVDKPTYSQVMPLLHDLCVGAKEQRKSAVAEMLGIHCEGPFIAVSGAHCDDCINRDDAGKVSSMGYTVSIGCSANVTSLKIVTLAPESVSTQLIQSLVASGVRVSAGHSNATLEQTEQAIGNGVSMVTHMFNAMKAFSHRSPGCIGLLGLAPDRQPFVSVIADGHHVHPCVVNMAWKCLKTTLPASARKDGLTSQTHWHACKFMLISDAISAAGLSRAQAIKVGCMEVRITDNGTRAVLKTDSSVLAGSVTMLDQCVRNLLQFCPDCTIAQAIEAASTIPARAMGVEKQKGQLIPGADADLVLMDRNNLSIVKVWKRGVLVT